MKKNLFKAIVTELSILLHGNQFDSKDLIAVTLPHRNITRWNASNGNPNYRLHTYKSYLRRAGFIKQVCKGTWEVVVPIPADLTCNVLELVCGVRYSVKYGIPMKVNGLTKSEWRIKLGLDKPKNTESSNELEVGGSLIAIDTCVMEDSGKPTLTVGKSYKIISDDGDTFDVIDDGGDVHSFEYVDYHHYFKLPKHTPTPTVAFEQPKSDIVELERGITQAEYEAAKAIVAKYEQQTRDKAQALRDEASKLVKQADGLMSRIGY